VFKFKLFIVFLDFAVAFSDWEQNFKIEVKEPVETKYE